LRLLSLARKDFDKVFDEARALSRLDGRGREKSVFEPG
jgi:hypothetical protein